MPDDAKTPMKTPMTSFSKGGGGSMPTPPAATGGDLEQRVADLEMRPRMPASGTGDDGNALVLDGVSPRWGEGGGGLPPITEEEKENMVLALIDIGGGTLEAQWAWQKLT
jgi:hypothetical protein